MITETRKCHYRVKRSGYNSRCDISIYSTNETSETKVGIGSSTQKVSILRASSIFSRRCTDYIFSSSFKTGFKFKIYFC